MNPDDDLIASLKLRLAEAPADPARPPATPAELDQSEAALGFALEPLLRRVYLEVADGGVGPGYGTLPLTGDESLSTTYATFRADGGWPEGLLPVWDWGDAIWSCVTANGGIITHDDVDGLTQTRFCVRSWLLAWADGVDVWREIYVDEVGTMINPFTRQPVAMKVRGHAIGSAWPTKGR